MLQSAAFWCLLRYATESNEWLVQLMWIDACMNPRYGIFLHLLQISSRICCKFHDFTLRRSGVYEPSLSDGRLIAAVAAAALAGAAVESCISSWYDNIAVFLAAAGAAKLILML